VSTFDDGSCDDSPEKVRCKAFVFVTPRKRCSPILNTSTEDTDDSSSVHELVIVDTESHVRFTHNPSLDPWTYDLLLLKDLRVFIDSTPGCGCLFHELFPQATEYLVTISVANEGLRHSLLSMAAIIRDMFQTREPSALFLTKKLQSLRLVQASLSRNTIDESLFAAIMCMVFTDYCMNDMLALKHHVGGLYLVYKHLQQRRKLTPLSRYIARVAGSKANLRVACYWGDFPQWPVFSDMDEKEDRKWLSAKVGFSRGMQSRDIEWALACFEINNLWHRTYTFAKRASIYRAVDPDAEDKISRDYQILQNKFQQWKAREVLINQEINEEFTQLINLSSETVPRFLHHDPLSIQDRFYAKLVNQWRAAQIYASRILSFPPNLSASAIDICRTHAALGQAAFNGPQWECLFHAGTVLGPLERSWILEQCKAIAAKMTVLVPLVRNMEKVWQEYRGDWNAFGKLYPRKDDTWFR